MIRAPLAPSEWPSAIAPPFTLTLSSGWPSSFALATLVGRVRKAAPDASCLVVGPTEQIARPARTLAVSRAFQAKATELGCAFWDAQEKLGGPAR